MPLNPAYFSITKDIVTALAAAATASAAVFGVNAWRRQLRGKENYDLARKLLRSAYKVRDSFSIFRNPAIFEFETKDAEKFLTEKEGVAPRRDQIEGEVYSRRWKPVAEALSEFQAMLLEAEVHWGTQARSASEELHRCARELLSSAQLHIASRDPVHRLELSKEDRQKIFDHLYARGKGDEFSDGVTKALHPIEDLCRAHLK